MQFRQNAGNGPPTCLPWSPSRALNEAPAEVSCVSSPFSLVKDAGRSAKPTKREALAVMIQWASSILADFVILSLPLNVSSGSSPAVPARQRRGRSTSRSGLPELDRADLKLRNLLAG